MKVKKQYDSENDRYSFKRTETPLINPKYQMANATDKILGFTADPIRQKALKENPAPIEVLGQWSEVMQEFFDLLAHKNVLQAQSELLLGGPLDEVLEKNGLPPLEGTAHGYTDAASFDHPLSIVARIAEAAHASSDPKAAFRTLKAESDALWRAHQEIVSAECSVEDLILATESMKQLYADTICKYIKANALTNPKSEKRARARDHAKNSIILGAENGQIDIDMLPAYLHEPLAQYKNNLFQEGCALVFTKLVDSFHSKESGAVAKAASADLAARRRAVTDKARSLLKGDAS